MTLFFRRYILLLSDFGEKGLNKVNKVKVNPIIIEENILTKLGLTPPPLFVSYPWAKNYDSISF